MVLPIEGAGIQALLLALLVVVRFDMVIAWILCIAVDASLFACRLVSNDGPVEKELAIDKITNELSNKHTQVAHKSISPKIDAATSRA